MGTINAYRDSSDPKVVHIVPSGFQPGETSPVNVKFNLTGYDEKIVQFTAQDTIAPPVQQAVEVSKTSITGYTDGSYIVNVTTQGTFTAVSDNSNIRVVSDQAQRTITVTVSPSSSQFSPQTGNITVSIPGYTDTVISVTLEAIDDIRVDAVPSGSKQYVNEPIVLTVSGTSKEVIAHSSDPLAVVTKNSDYEFTVLASGPCSATISFTGDGVKSRTKNFDFAEQEVPVITLNPSSGPYFIGSTVDVDITGITLFTGLQVTSSNSSLPITPRGGDGEYQIAVNAAGETTITVSNRGVVTTTKTLVGSALATLTAVPSTVSSRINTPITVTISGATGTIQVSSSDPKIQTQVSGNTIEVNATQECTGTITVTSPGANDLTIPVVFAQLQPISFDIDNPSGTLYIGESYRVTIESGLTNVNITTSDPRVTVAKVTDSPLVYGLYTTENGGITALTTDVTITADGKASTTFQLSYKELTEVTLVENHNGVPFDIPIELTIQNGVPGMMASSDNEYIHADIVEDPIGTYKVICRAEEIGDANIVVYGRTIATSTYAVSFINKDTVSINLTPSKGIYYVGDEIDIEVTGTTRDINLEVELVGGNGTPAEVTPGSDQYSKHVRLTTSGRFTVRVSGEGVASKTITKEVKELTSTSITLKPYYPSYYVGETVMVEVDGSVGTPVIEIDDGTGSAGSIQIDPSSTNTSKLITFTKACTATIRVSGDGINPSTTSITVEELQVILPSVTPTGGNGYVTKGVTIEIPGVENLNVETTVREFSIQKLS